MSLAFSATAIAIVLNALALFGDLSPRLDLISNLAPIIGVAGLLAALIAFIWRNRGLALVALLFAAGPPAYVVGQDAFALTQPLAPATGPVIRVMSVNALSEQHDISALENLIVHEHPDILFLQEANGPRGGIALERVTSLYPTNVMTRSTCSTRILTRFDVVEALPTTACATTSARIRLPPELGGDEVVIASVHYPRVERMNPTGLADAQLWAVVSSASGNSAIIGGDFNATPWSLAIRRLDESGVFERRTHALPTWPAPRWGAPPLALFPIDHIFASRDWRTVRVRRGPAVGSDHYPIIVELSRAATP